MNAITLYLITGCAGSFLLGYFLMPYLISYAHFFGLTDRPDGKLKRHAIPTAYLGGLGVALPFLVTTILLRVWLYPIGVVMAGCFALLVLGLYDDIYHLSPRTKIIIQAAIVLFLMGGGVGTEQTMLPALLWRPLLFLWMLTTINAFNLIDVRDGITATVSASCASGFALCALMAGQTEAAMLFVCLLGAVLAFFWFNQAPARIYLGDAGSLFLGGFFAAAPFCITWNIFHGWGFLAVPTILAIPFFEVITLIGVRLYYRIPFYNGSPHHFVHFLERKGWPLGQILRRTAALIGCGTLLTALFLWKAFSVIYWLPLGSAAYILWLLILMK